MSDFKHTPGPWIVGKSLCEHYPSVKKQFKPNHHQEIVNAVHGYMYAEDVFGFSEKENQQANAELIASAPEMYDQIQSLTAEVARLREAYERDCTPAYEEIAMRNQSLAAMNEKKQRLLEQACKEHGHDWRGDGDHCVRCGVADWIAAGPSDSTEATKAEQTND